MENDGLSEVAIGLGIEVHRELGPGLLESAYESCLCWELDAHQITYERQKPLPVIYKGHELEMGYRLDLVIENRLIIELKTIEKILPVHEAQLLTYLRLAGIKTGLIMNFLSPTLKSGLKRMVI